LRDAQRGLLTCRREQCLSQRAELSLLVEPDGHIGAHHASFAAVRHYGVSLAMKTPRLDVRWVLLKTVVIGMLSCRLDVRFGGRTALGAAQYMSVWNLRTLANDGFVTLHRNFQRVQPLLGRCCAPARNRVRTTRSACCHPCGSACVRRMRFDQQSPPVPTFMSSQHAAVAKPCAPLPKFWSCPIIARRAPACVLAAWHVRSTKRFPATEMLTHASHYSVALAFA